VALFLSKAKTLSNNESHRTYFVQSLETIGFELKEFEQVDQYVKAIAS
jgi:hypothetical protein